MSEAPVEILLILGEVHSFDDRDTVPCDGVCGISNQVFSLPKVVFGLVEDLGLVVDIKVMTVPFILINRRKS